MEYLIPVEVENLAIYHSDHGTSVSWVERSEDRDVRQVAVEMESGEVKLDGALTTELVRSRYVIFASRILEDLMDNINASV